MALKRLWWKFYHLIKFILPVFCILLMSQNVGAVGLVEPKYCSVTYSNGYLAENNIGSASGSCSVNFSGPAGYINNYRVQFATAIPANSVISLDYQIKTAGFEGATPEYDNAYKISESCNFSPAGGAYTCNVHLRFDASTDWVIARWNGINGGYNGSTFKFSVGAASYIGLDETATSEDITNLGNKLGGKLNEAHDTQIQINNNILDLKKLQQEAINAQKEQAQKEDEHWQEEQTEKDNISNQDGSNLGIDTSSTTNIIGAISTMGTSIINTPATTCSIPMNFGHLNLGDVNVCDVPDWVRKLCSTVIYCAFIIWVFYTFKVVVYKFIQLFEEFFR